MDIPELVISLFNDDLLIPHIPDERRLVQFLKFLTWMLFEGQKTGHYQDYKMEVLYTSLSDEGKTDMISYFNTLLHDYFHAQTYLVLDGNPAQLLDRLNKVQSSFTSIYESTVAMYSDDDRETALDSFVECVLGSPIRKIVLDAYMLNLNKARSGLTYDFPVLAKGIAVYLKFRTQGDARLFDDLFETIEQRAIQKARALSTSGMQKYTFEGYMQMALTWIKLEEKLYDRLLGWSFTCILLKAVHAELLERNLLRIVQLLLLFNDKGLSEDEYIIDKF